MDCRTAVAESCACTLTKHNSFSVAGRDTVAVTKPINVAIAIAIAIADARRHTVSIAQSIAIGDPDPGRSWCAPL
jgi:hypothetical protein